MVDHSKKQIQGFTITQTFTKALYSNIYPLYWGHAHNVVLKPMMIVIAENSMNQSISTPISVIGIFEEIRVFW